MSGVPLGYYYGQKFVRGDMALLDHSYSRPFQSLVHHNRMHTQEPRTILQLEEPREAEDEVDVCGGVQHVSDVLVFQAAITITPSNFTTNLLPNPSLIPSPELS